MRNYPKVAIIYLSFHCEPYLNDVISGLRKMTYPKDRVEFIVVDNPHPEHGSSTRFLQENLMPLAGHDLPSVTILPQATNLGFSGGNNVGIKWALERGFDYIYLHNYDGFVTANFLEPLVAAMETDKNIGVVQSLMMLYPDTDLINSTGNSFHYLGLGFCNNLRRPIKDLILPAIAETAYASGAAVLLRADLLQKFGVWDEDYVLYHEDIEYSFRLRIAGYKIVVARDSIFYHKYSFSRNKGKFYLIERNRYGLMLMYFKWPTLVLFLPAAIFLDLGLLLFAALSGWFKEKLRAYGYWLQIKNWRLWLAKRRHVQTLRVVPDKELTKLFTGQIVFGEKGINNPLLKYVGNPILSAYWWIARKIIFW
ncbi:MAG: glycosyltransferase family 2 protein [Patescibacteria group bacterium]|nr:glycosyltransferase family 2 protein [Patescibacteria group bacterium]